MDDIIALKNRLDVCKERFARPKYLHPKTVANFIFHFDSLKGDNKKLVFQYLNNYLNELETLQDITRNECADLFDLYILPVTKIYNREAGFMPAVSLFTILLWFGGIGTIILLLNLTAISFSILALLLITYYSYVFWKRMQKKVYGLMF